MVSARNGLGPPRHLARMLGTAVGLSFIGRIQNTTASRFLRLVQIPFNSGPSLTRETAVPTGQAADGLGHKWDCSLARSIPTNCGMPAVTPHAVIGWKCRATALLILSKPLC
jgi:hypothetical protein